MKRSKILTQYFEVFHISSKYPHLGNYNNARRKIHSKKSIQTHRTFRDIIISKINHTKNFFHFNTFQ